MTVLPLTRETKQSMIQMAAMFRLLTLASFIFLITFGREMNWNRNNNNSSNNELKSKFKKYRGIK